MSWHCIHWKVIWFPFFWSPFVTIKITQKYFVSSQWELSRSTPLATFKHAQQGHRLSSLSCTLHPWFIHFTGASMYLPTPFPHFAHSQHPTPHKHHSFLWMHEFGEFCSFVFYIPYVSETIWYLSFSVWLISLSIIPSKSIHAANGTISFFFSLMAESYSLYIYTPSFLSVYLWMDT